VFKKDLWCGYCGTQDFIELPDLRHPGDSRYSGWECVACRATFEDNPGYWYFTTYWGDNDECDEGKYSLNTGETLDDGKPPRTPEGEEQARESVGDFLVAMDLLASEWYSSRDDGEVKSNKEEELNDKSK